MSIHKELGFFLIAALLLISQPAHADKAEDLMQQAANFAKQGQTSQALDNWQQAVHAFRAQQQHEGQSRAWYRIGMLHFQDGRYTDAIHAFNQAQYILSKHPHAAMQSAVSAAMGSVYLKLGDLVQASPLLTDALSLARQQGLTGQTAAILNDLANLAVRKGQHASALKYYKEALSLAVTKPSLSLLRIRLYSNAIVAAQLAGKTSRVRKYSQQLQGQVKQLAQGETKIRALIQAGTVFGWLTGVTSKNRQDYANQAARLFQQAIKLTDNNTQALLRSQALGNLSQLYYHAKRDQDALRLNRQAWFLAQQINARQLMARWQWLAGRIFVRQAQQDKAITAYQQAIELMPAGLHSVRLDQELSAYFTAGNIHIEYAELLLQKSAATKDKTQRQKLLYQVRSTVESLKAAELQDYFQDSCVTATRTQVKKLEDTFSAGTAVLYPIVFADRIELLFSHSQGIERYQMKVKSEEVKAVVRQLRNKLERRRTRDYLPHAQRLYDWLIRPLQNELVARKINTLVTVPDLLLRSVPIAALHDGKQFLIERLAVATSPGLELTDPRVSDNSEPKLLLGGLTQSVQGYPALLHVRDEVNNIHRMYGGNMLLDDAFQTSQMKQALSTQGYTVAHIASHGEFGSSVDDSFLLTYDSRVRVNDLASAIGLGRFADQPLELLTLSACYTAAGDDRAALGLAGITVKAGARSALASLWPINDHATAKLMSAFYREWQKPGTGKAAALRRAQLEMLGDIRYRHPGYWSPFIMIGNWR